MPDQINSSSARGGRLDSTSQEHAKPANRSRLTQTAAAARKLAGQLKSRAMGQFASLAACFGSMPRFLQSKTNALKHAVGHLRNDSDGNRANRKIDSGLPVTKQLQAQSAMSMVDSLEKITSNKLWSKNGDVNLSFIEHFCGLRSSANDISPQNLPRSNEGRTELLAPYKDFTLGIVDNEIRLIDSMLQDIQQNDDICSVCSQTRAAMTNLSWILKDSASMMTMISRAALLSSGNILDKVSHAAQCYIDVVNALPPGGKILLPLAFFSKGIQTSQMVGHATYMVIEKNQDSTVNLHMVNRGAGNECHVIQQGTLAVSGKHPKTESAMSKWSLPVGEVGGFSHNFLVKTLQLTLDVDVSADGYFSPRSNADPKRQMLANIAAFYHEFGKRYLTQIRPVDREPVYQRPQKDGNCAYSNLKASIRYLLADQSMYNKIDLLKTEKVACLASKYLLDKLPKAIHPETAVLNRFAFDAERAVEVLLSKHEKADLRVKIDRGAALPLDLSEHLRAVTR